MSGAVSSTLGAPKGRYQSNPATREAPWVRYTLLALGLSFFVLFLILPLVAVFTEALRKGWDAYLEALKEGWPLPPTWEGYSQHAYDTLPLPTRYISGPEVLAFRDQAFTTYFNNPRYREHVAATFGPEGSQMIEAMTAHKLERKHLPAAVQ